MNHTAIPYQTSHPGTGNFYRTRMIPVIFLIVILFFSAWVRFDGITEQGIKQGDNFRYVREAKIWADGQPPEFAEIFYRPVSYLLQAAAIKIFGYNDYSIKIFHGFMDLINILLIFLIAARLAKNLWVGVVSSLLYGFLPSVISFTRSELVHVETTTFVLLALFFFILSDSKGEKGFKVYLFIFLAGLNSGLAANTHADIAFLAPGYVFYLFIKSYDSQNKKESFKKFFTHAFIFSIAFFTPYFLGLLLFGIKKVLQVLLSELSAAQAMSVEIYGKISKPLVFLYIFYYLMKSYFGKQVLLMGILLLITIFIMIYRRIKKKKESDPLLGYLPFILIFFYALLHACFFDVFSEGIGRYLMPLLPMTIFIITLWYYKIFKQLLGKYSLIAFICLFTILFLLNPKTLPGKMKYKFQYRYIYDILKDDVDSQNKLLIAPAAAYSFDRGFTSDLYFGKNAVYMCHLPIKDEYNLKFLKELLRGRNIRYIFLGKRIDPRISLNLTPRKKNTLYHRWFRNDKNPYSLRKDLEIIKAYIRSRGGLPIAVNRFGKIYYLTDEKPVSGKSDLIINGSFEYWWKGFPMGKWKLVKGRISRSAQATEGSSSICFEPCEKTGTSLVWIFRKPLYENASTLRVCLDARAGESNKFVLFFTAKINERWKMIEPNIVSYTGKNEWVTFSENFAITPGMKMLCCHLRLLPGARRPAFVDNLSIITVMKD
jgi:hypothetical protein